MKNYTSLCDLRIMRFNALIDGEKKNTLRCGTFMFDTSGETLKLSINWKLLNFNCNSNYGPCYKSARVTVNN